MSNISLNNEFSPWPSYSKEEADAVKDVILSNKVNYWTGTECRDFEREFAAWIGASYAVAVSNGTLALDAALHALGVGAGDEVVVTPRTFIASVSCVVNAGATPVFADVDRNSGNISAETISKVITEKTKAVIVVHLAGYPCDMDPIMRLAELHGIKVIEDCAQAHGARYKGRSVGSIGHVAAWSFCQDKIMTTGGEGGMVTTSDPKIWSKIWSLKDHGKSWEAMQKSKSTFGFSWVHESFGNNWRMMEVQAVIGRIQLKRMPDWSNKRRRSAEKIREVCRKYPAIRVPVFDDHGGDSCHASYKCYVYVDSRNLAVGWSRDRIIQEINAERVPCYQGSCSEVYLERAFDGTGYRPENRLMVAKELGETSLMLLVHPTLTDENLNQTCDVLNKVLSRACR